MTRPKRFVFVRGPKPQSVYHYLTTHAMVEGALTDCGRRIKKGWLWAAQLEPSAKRCKQCQTVTEHSCD